MTINFAPIDIRGNNQNRARPVIMLDPHGKKPSCKYPSVHDAARLMNIPAPNIVSCLKGRLKTAGGYIWKYADSESGGCSYGK